MYFRVSQVTHTEHPCFFIEYKDPTTLEACRGNFLGTDYTPTPVEDPQVTFYSIKNRHGIPVGTINYYPNNNSKGLSKEFKITANNRETLGKLRRSLDELIQK